jgi:hypothetical protein
MNDKWLMVLVTGSLIHKPTSTLHTAAAARGNEPVFRRLQIREHQLITEELCSVSVLEYCTCKWRTWAGVACVYNVSPIASGEPDVLASRVMYELSLV